MDNLDHYLLQRRILINRKDILRSLQHLHILIVLRKLKSGSGIAVFIELKKIKRTTAKNLVFSCLNDLITAGYARQNVKGGRYYITETGIQALKDFNNSIEAADYVNYNKKAPVSKIVKRPGI